MDGIEYTIAGEDWQFEAIHRLNYQTFVEEIPQHRANDRGTLIDRFHDENTYVVACIGRRVVGMIAIRDRRPFSLDQKLPHLDRLLPPATSVCEVRLLSIERDYRHSRVFLGLFRTAARHLRSRGFDLAVISGIIRHLRLYRQLGFVAFGPRVGTADALYQPMYLTLAGYLRESARFETGDANVADEVSVDTTVWLHPGPVTHHPDVAAAHAAAPISHRSDTFTAMLAELRRRLRRLTGAQDVQVIAGSGTLANDCVAARLDALDQPGLILSSGEFGDRLVDHARRRGLTFSVLRGNKKRAVAPHDIEQALAGADVGWIWFTHCETSTGVLQDIATVHRVIGARDVRVCIDAISTIGTIPVDLSRAYLATATSGKGLGAFAGLGLVFHDHPIEPAPATIPRALDIGLAAREGCATTLPSGTVHALTVALRRTDFDQRHATIRNLAARLRERFERFGVPLLVDAEKSSPAILTIGFPDSIDAVEVARQLENDGFALYARSAYLMRANRLQVCLMGTAGCAEVLPVARCLARAVRRTCAETSNHFEKPRR